MGGLLGLAVGNALGVLFESNTLEEMRQNSCTDLVRFRKHRHPAGTWSDNTSMALCIADSLGTKGIDPDDSMKKFSLWKSHHQYTAGGKLFDIGRVCRRAIETYEQGQESALCGNFSETGNGNGSLM